MVSRLISIEDTVQKTDTVISSDLDEVTVMMDIEKGQYYCLNRMGMRIWGMLGAPITVISICDRLMANFEVPVQQCREEVLAYLNKLLQQNVVKITEPNRS